LDVCNGADSAIINTTFILDFALPFVKIKAGGDNMENIIIIQGETPKRKFPVNLEDPLQKRYEFIREGALSKESVAQICKKYGLSRDMYYYYRNKFDEGGLIALQEEKPGPRQPHKINKELENRIIGLKFAEPELNIYQLVHRLKSEGYDISPRSISRVLAEHELTKKNCRAVPERFLLK